METTKTSTVESQAWPAADHVRIVITPGTCGGRPRIDGHRITVQTKEGPQTIVAKNIVAGPLPQPLAKPPSRPRGTGCEVS